jgi:hypothetical protein
LRNVVKCGCYSLAKFVVFQSFNLYYKREIDNQMIKLIINFPFVIKYKMTENGKLRKPILSAFYNISQRNFGILLILWCSFKLSIFVQTCLDQNFTQKGKGLLRYTISTMDWHKKTQNSARGTHYTRAPNIQYLTAWSTFNTPLKIKEIH